jgi:hypothetical protein
MYSLEMMEKSGGIAGFSIPSSPKLLLISCINLRFCTKPLINTFSLLDLPNLLSRWVTSMCSLEMMEKSGGIVGFSIPSSPKLLLISCINLRFCTKFAIGII